MELWKKLICRLYSRYQPCSWTLPSIKINYNFSFMMQFTSTWKMIKRDIKATFLLKITSIKYAEGNVWSAKAKPNLNCYTSHFEKQKKTIADVVDCLNALFKFVSTLQTLKRAKFWLLNCWEIIFILIKYWLSWILGWGTGGTKYIRTLQLILLNYKRMTCFDQWTHFQLWPWATEFISCSSKEL